MPAKSKGRNVPPAPGSTPGNHVNWTILVGRNRVSDCNGVLEIEGIEVFRLRDRAADDRLVVDFEVRDEQDKLVAKISKNNAVFARPGVEPRNEPHMSEVVDTTTDHVYACAQEVDLRTVRLSGIFVINGYRVVITKDTIRTSDDISIEGNDISKMGQGITLKRGSVTLG